MATLTCRDIGPSGLGHCGTSNMNETLLSSASPTSTGIPGEIATQAPKPTSLRVNLATAPSKHARQHQILALVLGSVFGSLAVVVIVLRLVSMRKRSRAARAALIPYG